MKAAKAAMATAAAGIVAAGISVLVSTGDVKTENSRFTRSCVQAADSPVFDLPPVAQAVPDAQIQRSFAEIAPVQDEQSMPYTNSMSRISNEPGAILETAEVSCPELAESPDIRITSVGEVDADGVKCHDRWDYADDIGRYGSRAWALAAEGRALDEAGRKEEADALYVRLMKIAEKKYGN